MRNKRIVLDTNLWISFLITRSYKALFESIESGDITLLVSPELLKEIISVTKRSKFSSYFSSREVEILLKSIVNYSEIILTESNLSLCRDPKDNFLLNLCIDGKADYLVSGDKDLLSLNAVGNTQIIDAKELRNKMKDQE